MARAPRGDAGCKGPRSRHHPEEKKGKPWHLRKRLDRLQDRSGGAGLGRSPPKHAFPFEHAASTERGDGTYKLSWETAQALNHGHAAAPARSLAFSLDRAISDKNGPATPRAPEHIRMILGDEAQNDQNQPGPFEAQMLAAAEGPEREAQK